MIPEKPNRWLVGLNIRDLFSIDKIQPMTAKLKVSGRTQSRKGSWHEKVSLMPWDACLFHRVTDWNQEVCSKQRKLKTCENRGEGARGPTAPVCAPIITTSTRVTCHTARHPARHYTCILSGDPLNHLRSGIITTAIASF